MDGISVEVRTYRPKRRELWGELWGHHTKLWVSSQTS
jgi:hypothetical protein